MTRYPFTNKVPALCRPGSAHFPLAAAAGVLLSLGMLGTAHAQSGVWANTQGGVWSAPANWVSGGIADGDASLADFSAVNLVGDVTVHLDSPRTVGNLTFGDTDLTTPGGWLLDNNGDPFNTLTLSFGNTITVNELAAGKAATISANITGAITKQGAGTLVLSGTNDLGGNQFQVLTGSTVRLAGTTGGVTNLFLRGTSNLILDNGAALTTGVNNSYVSLGLDGTDDATILLKGNATWTHQGGDFNVSDVGTSHGSFTLQDNSSLTSGGPIFVSKNNGTSAEFHIDTTGSVSTTANFVVGQGGGSNGTLTQSTGTLTVGGETWIGNGNGGNGTFNKTGGVTQANNWFVVGRNANGGGATGVMNFSGGSLNKANGGNFIVADGGGSVGTLNMSGDAALTVDNELWVGQGGGNGTLNMLGGTIAANNWVAIGRNGGTGTFNLTGGTVTKNNNNFFIVGDAGGSNGTMNVGGTGAFNLDGGLRIGQNLGNGTLNMDGGSITANASVSLGFDGGTGVFNLKGGTVTKQGNNDFVVGDGVNPNSLAPSTGTLNVSATGALNIANQLWIGQGGGKGTVTMTSGSVTVNNWAVVGRQGGTGVLNLQGGSFIKQGANAFIVGSNAGVFGAGGNGTLNQTGGTLSVSGGETWIGEGAVGVWDISGGTVTTEGFRVGRNGAGTGTLTLHGDANVKTWGLSLGQANTAVGNVTVSENAVLTMDRILVGDGDSGKGTFTQNGGTVTIIGGRGENKIGNAAGTTGTYNMAGGTMSVVDNIHIGGNGTGTFNQTGGTVTASTYPSVGRFAGSVGVLNVSAGTFTQVPGGATPGVLIVGEEGTGTLNVSGTGIVDVTGDQLNVGQQGSGNGTINLNGGTIRTNAIVLGAGAGQLNFNGGTVAARRDEFDLLRGFTAANTEILAGGATLDTAGFNVAINTSLDGVGGFTKKGAGTVTFNGANTYTGVTAVQQGTLAVSFSGHISGSIAVSSGATLDVSSLTDGAAIDSGNTLSGEGLVLGVINLLTGAHLSPGINSNGTLTLQTGLTLADAGGAVLDFSLGTTSDLIAITGGTFLGNSSGKTLINVTNGGGLAQGVYTLIRWTGANASGVDLGDFQLGAFPNGTAGTLQMTGDSLQLTVVPEPATAGLLCAGLAMLGLRRRRS